MRPAAVKRVPAKNIAGTASTPALMPIQVVPQMTQSSRNSQVLR
jgi:hypothetical protein